MRILRTFLSDRRFGCQLLRRARIYAGCRYRADRGTSPQLAAHLEAQGFRTEVHAHSGNAPAPGSELRIQFTTDQRYQAFLSRSVDAEVLGMRVRIACREDVTQGTLWAYSDPRRRLSKRKKDETGPDPARRSLSRAEISIPLNRGNNSTADDRSVFVGPGSS